MSSKIPRAGSFKSKSINQTLEFDGNEVKDHDIGIIRKPYLLEKAEFQALSKHDVGFKEWAKRMLIISIGLAINLVSKIISFLYTFENTSNEASKLELELGIRNWEWIALGLALVSSVILYILGRCFKNDRDILIEKIQYFYNGKRSEKT